MAAYRQCTDNVVLYNMIKVQKICILMNLVPNEKV